MAQEFVCPCCETSFSVSSNNSHVAESYCPFCGCDINEECDEGDD